MKRNRSLSLNETGEVIIPPAFPTQGYVVFQKFRSLLAANQKAPSIPLHRLMKLVGLPLGTCYGWFATDQLQEVQALLCLMERVPKEEWRRVLRSFLRQFPTFEHPRLAKNPETVGRLEQLLTLRRGLTLILGGKDDDRTFVFSALGHAFAKAGGPRRMPAGMDAHTPRKFVPIESILYLRDTLPRQRLGALIHEKWRQVKRSNAPWLMFNGILSVAPNLLPEIVELAKKRHVVVAEPSMTHRDLALRRRQIAIRTLELSAGPGNSIQIHLER